MSAPFEACIGCIVEAAKLHAAQAGVSIDYRTTTAEALADAGERYDVVLAMEVVEHVGSAGTEGPDMVALHLFAFFRREAIPGAGFRLQMWITVVLGMRGALRAPGISRRHHTADQQQRQDGERKPHAEYRSNKLFGEMTERPTS